jgi:hypothetical protein
MDVNLPFKVYLLWFGEMVQGQGLQQRAGCVMLTVQYACKLSD